MFAKLYQEQKLQATRECQNSEEEETITKKSRTAEANNSDGATIEVVRRPRGRPPGSKNKPKPPLIITRDTECAMRPHVLEVPGGFDVIDVIARFASHRNMGLSVLSGSGNRC
ncbi:hypothetical protein HHK36_031950 [Tetracentron sinense]|uniref:PPC domain-containing protein n=1 Tax=Tetracentron sinense TaxID=13715 RepID=A0A835CY32_TETSI|nr:hypothetical protein HHK36_031950 [Tetracentron sinense]